MELNKLIETLDSARARLGVIRIRYESLRDMQLINIDDKEMMDTPVTFYQYIDDTLLVKINTIRDQLNEYRLRKDSIDASALQYYDDMVKMLELKRRFFMAQIRERLTLEDQIAAK